MNVRHLITRTIRVGVLVLSFVVAGTLFLGVPAATGSAELPDPELMSAVGEGRKTSSEIVDFWAQKVSEKATTTALTNLASAKLTLASDSGDLGGYSDAEEAARVAVESQPDDAAAILVLAASYAGQHDFAEALELAETVLGSDPTSTGALLIAGDAYRDLGDYTSAQIRYGQARALEGDIAPLLSRQARFEATTGSLSQARELSRQALITAGDDDLRHADAAFYWFQYASYDVNSGNYTDARDSLTKALAVDPGHLGARELLAQVLTSIGDYDEAISLYEELVGDAGAADLHGKLGALYFEVGRVDEAVAQRELALTIAFRDADLYVAERRHMIGFLADVAPEEALRLAELDLADRQDIESHAWYAWALLKTGQPDAAAIAIEPALRFNTENAWLLYQAGSIYAAVGETERASELLSRALDLSPQFDLVHAQLARDLRASLATA